MESKVQSSGVAPPKSGDSSEGGEGSGRGGGGGGGSGGGGLVGGGGGEWGVCFCPRGSRTLTWTLGVRTPVEWAVKRRMWLAFPPLKYHETSARYENSWEFEEAYDMPGPHMHLLGTDGTATADGGPVHLEPTSKHIYTGLARSYCLLAIYERLAGTNVTWYLMAPGGHGGAARDVLRLAEGGVEPGTQRDIVAIRLLVNAYSVFNHKHPSKTTLPVSIRDNVYSRLRYRDDAKQFSDFMTR